MFQISSPKSGSDEIQHDHNSLFVQAPRLYYINKSNKIYDLNGMTSIKLVGAGVLVQRAVASAQKMNIKDRPVNVLEKKL